jgi:hypothetical protein
MVLVVIAYSTVNSISIFLKVIFPVVEETTKYTVSDCDSAKFDKTCRLPSFWMETRSLLKVVFELSAARLMVYVSKQEGEVVENQPSYVALVVVTVGSPFLRVIKWAD